MAVTQWRQQSALDERVLLTEADLPRLSAGTPVLFEAVIAAGSTPVVFDYVLACKERYEEDSDGDATWPVVQRLNQPFRVTIGATEAAVQVSNTCPTGSPIL